ncbi:MAG: hypothetical protein ABEI52_11770 [Halobacteriaceae archaeon]
MEATRTTSAIELRSALEEGLATDDPMLVEVMTAPNEPQAHHWMAESE